MRLLVVEDDRMIGESVRTALRQEGYAADWVHEGLAADAALRAESYDLVLLDLGLPGPDGIEVLRELRTRGAAMPVLVMTARDAVGARVAGLDAGADDYLVKPFDVEELLARVRALLRRRNERREAVLRHGGLVLDPARHETTLDGVPVKLTLREFELLRTLLQRPGQPLSRARLEQALYGWGEEIESNAIEVHIHALRRKLGGGWIHTVRGVGYMVPKQS
ncbi:MAG: response regulator transcription factor [Alphaproteobacteria bacterium]|nr:response regulator transcription factor [Alphaproteobacteria bacterium]